MTIIEIHIFGPMDPFHFLLFAHSFALYKKESDKISTPEDYAPYKLLYDIEEKKVHRVIYSNIISAYNLVKG